MSQNHKDTPILILMSYPTFYINPTMLVNSRLSPL